MTQELRRSFFDKRASLGTKSCNPKPWRESIPLKALRWNATNPRFVEETFQTRKRSSMRPPDGYLPPCDDGARNSEDCTQENDQAEAKDERFSNGGADGTRRSRIHPGRRIEAA